MRVIPLGGCLISIFASAFLWFLSVIISVSTYADPSPVWERECQIENTILKCGDTSSHLIGVPLELKIALVNQILNITCRGYRTLAWFPGPSAITIDCRSKEVNQ